MAFEEEFNYLFDPNDESKRIYKELRQYYGKFTTDVREDLLRKNVSTPTSILDATYRQRQDLLSKNIPQFSSIEDESEQIRNELLSKIVKSKTNIQEQSESYRNEMLRKIGLNFTDILSTSEGARESMLGKIVPSTSDIETDSAPYRADDLEKVVPSTSDIEVDSVPYREEDKKKNVLSTSDIEKDSKVYREEDKKKVVPSTSSIETDSETYRREDLEKVVPSTSDIETDSEVYRKEDLEKVVTSTSDIETDSETYRREDLEKVVTSTSDIETDSEPYRADDLEKVVPSSSDIETDSETYRREDLEKVVPSSSDIETDSETYRREDLEKVVPSTSDIETDSAPYRADDLEKVVPSTSDIETDSEVYRTDDLQKIVPSSSDIETDSAPYRADDLEKVVPSSSDIETDSEDYRREDLEKVVTSTSDIETDSAPYRADDLEKVVPSSSDIETDSESYRADDLENNVPSNSDIETDSEPYREEDLQNNVPSTSDIETDSEPYRADDLENNVPSNSDIETDSEPYREEDLEYNVPSESDIETDSIPFRLEDLTNNAPSESDIETDSEPYREDDLSNNTPSESDIEEDSIPFRIEDLSQNVALFSDIETDSEPYRTDDLSQNVPSFSNIEDDSEVYRQEDLANNVFVQSNILTDSEAPRQSMLSANEGLGLIGVNFQGLGTSAFVGISRNYALGLIVRQLLFTKNEYTPRRPYSTSGADAKILDGNYTGYFGRTVAEEINDQIRKIDQEVRPSETKTYESRKALIEFPLDAYFQEDPKGQMNMVYGAGNRMQDRFDARQKSIKNLMDSINNRNLGDAPLAGNYDKNSKVFLIGGKESDGVTNRVARKRYTIDNPYFSGGDQKTAGKLLFSITNYAIPTDKPFRTMFFPPYIQSFQENANANWTAHEFLGRPEPIYTYNNATRGGSITFYVLADYAQDVEVGTDWTSEELQKIIFNTRSSSNSLNIPYKDEHFSDRFKYLAEIFDEKAILRASNRTLSEEINKLYKLLDEITGQNLTDGTSEYSSVVPALQQDSEAVNRINEEIREKQNEINKNTDRISLLNQKKGSAPEGSLVLDLDNEYYYSESTTQNGNTISSALGVRNSENFAMIQRLANMKENLQYQPAYFSGDKVDFERKMTFLQRLLRPRKAALSERMGFTFTKPPVSHIRLGDWLNHDCVITDVSFDYSESMWSLETIAEDNVGVQPMYAVVTINFNIIGQFDDRGGGMPLLADDDTGYYNTYYDQYVGKDGTYSIEAGTPQGEFIPNQ